MRAMDSKSSEARLPCQLTLNLHACIRLDFWHKSLSLDELNEIAIVHRL